MRNSTLASPDGHLSFLRLLANFVLRILYSSPKEFFPRFGMDTEFTTSTREIVCFSLRNLIGKGFASYCKWAARPGAF